MVMMVTALVFSSSDMIYTQILFPWSARSIHTPPISRIHLKLPHLKTAAGWSHGIVSRMEMALLMASTNKLLMSLAV